MSARITIYCDQHVDQWSDCGARINTTATALAEARAYAARVGWSSTGTRDLCPRHSPTTHRLKLAI